MTSIFNEAELENPVPEEKGAKGPRDTAEKMKRKLDRLMAKPDKLVIIPERPKEWTPRAPREFIRSVWGSSSGAGSGDFHIYRGIRRREYMRQAYNAIQIEKEKKEKAYAAKIQEREKKAEHKREKRQRKKEKLARHKKRQRLEREQSKATGGEETIGAEGDSSSTDSDIAELLGDIPEEIDEDLLNAL